MMQASNPVDLFGRWYAQARRSGIEKPHAMALSTTGQDGRPSSRMVLLSSFDENGFVFHTNGESRKAQDIAHQSWVALLFWWDELRYQVRIEGRAGKTLPEEADAYFRQRPRGSQLGAWVSEQSRVVAGREVLEARMASVSAKFAGQEIPRPPHWGGYRIDPQVFEFWQEGEDRLHERVRFQRREGEWLRECLAP